MFDNFRVPAANLIGGEGQGFYCAVSGLELGRINVAARGAGIAKAALDESVRYAQLRKTFGKPIGEHQAIQLKLGEMATRVEAARLLIEQAAQAYDAGRRCDMEAGMAKYFASEAGLENALEAMRIHGALRLLEGISDRAAGARRAAHVHRRGHQRDAADHHRAPADRAKPGLIRQRPHKARRGNIPIEVRRRGRKTMAASCVGSRRW